MAAAFFAAAAAAVAVGITLHAATDGVAEDAAAVASRRSTCREANASPQAHPLLGLRKAPSPAAESFDRRPRLLLHSSSSPSSPQSIYHSIPFRSRWQVGCWRDHRRGSQAATRPACRDTAGGWTVGWVDLMAERGQGLCRTPSSCWHYKLSRDRGGGGGVLRSGSRRI